jgi:hypothetical protein
MSDAVIIATLAMATALRASPFPEWQDEPEPPPERAGTHDCIEENS